MGKAIVLAILILLGCGAWSWLCFYGGVAVTRDRIIRQGGAGQQGVDLVKEAHGVFTEQLNPSTLIQAGGYDMLSTETTEKVEAWMHAYNKWRGKVR